MDRFQEYGETQHEAATESAWVKAESVLDDMTDEEILEYLEAKGESFSADSTENYLSALSILSDEYLTGEY